MHYKNIADYFEIQTDKGSYKLPKRNIDSAIFIAVKMEDKLFALRKVFLNYLNSSTNSLEVKTTFEKVLIQIAEDTKEYFCYRALVEIAETYALKNNLTPDSHLKEIIKKGRTIVRDPEWATDLMTIYRKHQKLATCFFD